MREEEATGSTAARGNGYTAVAMSGAARALGAHADEAGRGGCLRRAGPDAARRALGERDEEALHRLITAYMRLAISMAAKFKRYGAPMNDLIQEAGLGLMKAADKFDPDRGVRFSTYAVWWIKASIQDYVMRNWSMVRTGSTSSRNRCSSTCAAFRPGWSARRWQRGRRSTSTSCAR
jgi:hypothetical protein